MSHPTPNFASVPGFGPSGQPVHILSTVGSSSTKPPVATVQTLYMVEPHEGRVSALYALSREITFADGYSYDDVPYMRLSNEAVNFFIAESSLRAAKTAPILAENNGKVVSVVACVGSDLSRPHAPALYMIQTGAKQTYVLPQALDFQDGHSYDDVPYFKIHKPAMRRHLKAVLPPTKLPKHAS